MCQSNCNCGGECIDATSVIYVGPNLPNTGILTNDSLIVALQKIDDTFTNLTTTTTTTTP